MIGNLFPRGFAIIPYLRRILEELSAKRSTDILQFGKILELYEDIGIIFIKYWSYRHSDHGFRLYIQAIPENVKALVKTKFKGEDFVGCLKFDRSKF